MEDFESSKQMEAESTDFEECISAIINTRTGSVYGGGDGNTCLYPLVCKPWLAGKTVCDSMTVHLTDCWLKLRIVLKCNGGFLMHKTINLLIHDSC